MAVSLSKPAAGVIILLAVSPVWWVQLVPRGYMTVSVLAWQLLTIWLSLALVPKSGLRPTTTIAHPAWGLYSTIEINAPAQHVWRILLDFDHYGEWNTFTDSYDSWPEAKTVGARGYHSFAFVPGGKRRRAPIEINELDDDSMRMCHKSLAMPSPLLFIERVQQVTDLGDGRCQFEQWNAQTGLMVPALMIMTRKVGQQGLNRMSGDLRRHAEATK